MKMRWVALLLVPLLIGKLGVAQEQKVIQNRPEYEAYMAASAETGPALRAAKMESFLQTYPGTVMRLEALQYAMQAYQQLSDQAKVYGTAGRILEVAPDNPQALAIRVTLERARLKSPDKAALDSLRVQSARGVKSLAFLPPGALATRMLSIFEGALGFVDLQSKEYTTAAAHFRKSLAADPESLSDNYAMSIACLQEAPPAKEGLWYAAKAVSIARAEGNNAAANMIESYGKSHYTELHGGPEGWDDIVTAAKGQTSPP